MGGSIIKITTRNQKYHSRESGNPEDPRFPACRQARREDGAWIPHQVRNDNNVFEFEKEPLLSLTIMIILKLLIYLILIAGPILAVWLWLKMRRAQAEIDWLKEQKFVLLRIMVPKNNEKTPLSAEQMFAALHGIFRAEEKFQKYLSFEIVSRDKYIQFYAAVPIELKDFVEGQIYSQYPTVEIEEISDYASPAALYTKEQALGQKLVYIGTELKLNNEDIYPIKTFPNFDVDPLAGITGVLSKIRPEEEVWIQILTRPVSDQWQTRGTSHVRALKSGLPTGKGGVAKDVAKEIGKFALDVGRGFTSQVGVGGGSGGAAPAGKEGGGAPAASGGGGGEGEKTGPTTPMAAIEQKAAKLGFETIIRILAISIDEISARGKVNSVVGAFKQYNSTNINGFKASALTMEEEFLRKVQARAFLGAGNVFNIEELASIFHLPNISVETPTIVWAGSKKGEPPANLPIKGSVPDEEITLFAKTNFRHLIHEFGIKLPDRRYHTYAIGQTGTGKSTLLENMIIDDIKEGRGVAVVDPHGDLIKHVIDFIPAKRINDVILFDPADYDYPVAFNILENVDPDLKNIIASGVVGIFKKIFGESWGPRLEYILRNTVLALLDYPGATMLGIMRLLTDRTYRKMVIEKVKDPVIRDFFINEYEQYDQKFRTEAIAPIQNKVGQFLSSSTIRNIVGQSKSTVNIEDTMNNGKILLLDLSIGKIGEDNSALLGSMMITKIQLAAMRRTLIPEEERRDFYLYVDEFQNFATESFATILSEARKYHLNLIMTHQYVKQMPEVVADAIFGNVGTMVAFRVGAPDAAALIKQFEPVFTEIDLVNLDNYHIYSKLTIDGVSCPPFSAVTLPPKRNPSENREKIIRVSREKYGKSRGEVEKTISDWAEHETGNGNLIKQIAGTGQSMGRQRQEFRPKFQQPIQQQHQPAQRVQGQHQPNQHQPIIHNQPSIQNRQHQNRTNQNQSVQRKDVRTENNQAQDKQRLINRQPLITPEEIDRLEKITENKNQTLLEIKPLK